LARRLVWVGLATAAAYAVFIGGSWFGIYDSSLRFATVVLAAVVLAGWAVVGYRSPEWRPRSVLLPAIIACVGSLAISTVFSRFPGVSVEYLAYAVVLAALYLLLVQLLARDFFRGRLVGLCGALFFATVGAYLALTISDWVQWLHVLGHFTIPPLRPEFESLTLGNPSAVLTLVALLAIPIVGALDWTTQRGLALAIVVLGLVAVVALISGSRAGWLALAIAGVVTLVGGALTREVRGPVATFLTRMRRSPTGRIVVLVTLAFVALVTLSLGPAILRRASEGGDENRIAFARIALELFAQSPIVGTGPGSWVIQRPGLTVITEPDEYIPHAHNIYAQTLGELGVVGAVAGLVLVALLARLVLGAMRDPDQARRRMGWAALIGLVYFGAHQLLDFYANFPAILMAAAIPVALLDATAARSPLTASRRVPSFAWAGATAGGLTVLAALLFLGAQELPAMDEANAVQLANAGDWAAAAAPARIAAAGDPRIGSYLFTAGLTAAHVGDHVAAARYFAEVTAENDVPEAWLDLAAEQVALGDRTSAASSLEAALRLGRQRPGVAIPIGDLALRIGQDELALEAFTAAVINVPSFLADPWWTLDPTRIAARDEVAARAMAATTADTQWEIALMTGDVANARTLAATPGLDPSTIDFVDAWTGDEAAFERLITRCQRDSLQLQPLFWCARIEGRRGDVDRANDYRYLANSINGGSYRNGAEIRVATESLVGRSSEGNLAIFWGTYTYRRPTPWDVLVPSLVHLTLE
jgi:O-antigen ligase